MSSFGFLIRSANLGYRSTPWKNIILLLGFLVTGCTSRSGLYDTEAPNFFTHEPPRFNYFPNDKGLLLQCVARGSPRPSITWINAVTGEPIDTINGLIQILPNGSIFYPPFNPSFYRPDVHNATVYCIASNAAGQIRSRDATIRAVMNQREEIHLEDVYTTKGNDALLKCIIPEAIKEFVSVTSWIKDSTFNIFPHSGGGGGRYFMVPSGELLIEGATLNDTTSTFQCRTVNRLTGETLESETLARVKLQGDEMETAPRIISHVAQLRLKEGETGVLICFSDGHPTPTQGWFKADGFGGFENLRQTDRVRIRRSVVIIENVGIQDAGTYICNATNRYGSASHQIQLIVQAPLAVQVLPSVLTVDVGKSAEFTCWTNSPDIVTSNADTSATNSNNKFFSSKNSQRGSKIRWFKNGKELMESSRVAIGSNGNKLRISYVQREDIGMIQCMVVTDKDMSQGVAQLRLGDASPHFIYRFIEQTLQPGQYVSLKCTASGNPTPRITWLLDGFAPPISERLLIGQYVTMNGDVVSHLNISRTKVEDGGEYTCTVNNTHGTLSHSARLNIYGPPYVRPMPPITAIAGKTLSIKCPAAGFPLEWPIVWEKGNQVLPLSRRQVVSPDGVLTITDVDRQADADTYTCTARNKQGHSDQKTVQVHVVVGPKVSFNFPRSVSAGERLVVICYVSEGDTPIEIKWLKDSQPIVPMAGDQMDRQVSTTRGDFDLALRINPLSAFDSGVYTCSATNKYGEARHSATLVVQVPPRITPFFFPDSVQVNQRAQVVCALQEGDPYTTSLMWLKNSEPISTTVERDTSKTKIIEVQRDVSLLIIDGADSGDNGNYTCVAQSDMEGLSDSVTASLIVRVPPKWLVQPKEQLHVLNGDTLKIPCQASGFPVPTISWKKQMGNRAGSYHDILVQSPNVKSAGEEVLSDVNGTLVIRNANKGHQGIYLCEASNGIGSGISKVLRVVVNVPAKIKEREPNTTTRVRTNAILQCEAGGDPPLEISWRRNHLDNNLALDPRYYVQTVNSSGGGLLSELKINNVIREDNGRYICSASNPFGKDHASFWLVVKDVPDSPHGLILVTKGSRFVRLGWSLAPEEFGNSQIVQFIIKYLATSGAEPHQNEMEGNPAVGEVTVPGNVYSEVINNLKPATTYHFSVVAQNEVGISGPSERLDVATDGEPPPPPTNIQAVPLSATEIKILWDNSLSESSKNVRGYYVGFRRYREEEQYQFSAVDGNGLIRQSGPGSRSSIGNNEIHGEKESYKGEHSLRNLMPFTTYEIVIQGYNAFGVGALSEPMIANTLEDVPMFAPEGLTCSPVNAHSIQVSFQALPKAQARGVLTGYRIYVENADSEELDDEMIVKTTAATSIMINGLQPWTNYSVHVAGMTRIGEGVRSPPINCLTDEDVPGKLEAVKAVVSSPVSVIVSWLPPRKKNGRLVNYNLYVFDSNGPHSNERGSGTKKKTIAPTTTSYEVDGLKTNEKYEFRVAAVTSKGEGKSSISRQTPTKNFGAAIVSIGDVYSVIWKTDILLPCKAVGDPFPSHEWSKHLKPIERRDRVSYAGDGSLLIRDIRKEDEGEYVCVATNIRGSESINHTVYVQVPPAAPLVHGTSNTHNSIAVMWKQQEIDKVSSVKGYILHVKVRDEWTERRLSRHLNSYEITDLECGTRYQLYLTGFNAAGIGKASNILKNLTTLGGVPQLNLPTPEMMLQVNTTWIRVKLAGWSDNGCPIKQCRVLFRQQDHYFKWQTVAAEMNTLSRDVDLIGLKPGTIYTLRVSCRNSAGENEVEMNAKTLPLEESGTESSRDLLNNPIWKTAPAATTANTAFYLDWKLMGPIVLSSLAMIMAGGGLCLCIKKKPDGVGRSMEHLSGGTPSSSTYFKGNPRSNPHQLYMTVKKATPVKNQDLPTVDHIPQYAEDIYPYATFELNEPMRRDGRYNGPGTLERNRANHSAGARKSSKTAAELLSTAKYNSRYPGSKSDESEEYDSVDSDSDACGPNARPGEFFIEYQEPIESKLQDFEFPSSRCSNQYEMAPARNPLFNSRLKGKARDKHNRSSCDTATSAFCEPKQSRKTKSRAFPFGAAHSYGDAGKNFNPPHIEPPSGFGDKCLSINEPRSTQNSTEFAIAV